MVSVKELVSNYPFKDRLRFCGEKDVSLCFNKGKAFIVCEPSFRGYAKKLKDASDNADVSIIEASDERSIENLSSVSGVTVVSLLGKRLLNVLRKECVLGDNRLIAVLIDLSIASVFKTEEYFFQKRGLVLEKLTLPDKVLIDLNGQYVLKRSSIADGLCECAKLTSFLSEARICGKEVGDAEKQAKRIIDLISSAKNENLVSTVIKAELLAAKLYCEHPKAAFCPAYFVGKILNRGRFGVSEEEAEYAAAKAVAAFYSICLKAPVYDALVAPDHYSKLQKLSALLGGDELAYFDEFSPCDEKTVHDSLKKIVQAEDPLKTIDDALKTFGKLDKVYSLAYGGRKKRADFSAREIAFAISEGAYLSGGFLKLLCDGGVTGALYEAYER